MTRKATIDGLRITCLAVLMLVCASFFFGCRTTKTIDTTKIEWQTRDSTYTKDEGRKDSSWYQKLLTDTSWWSHVGHITIYDTSAPKDSATGQHPIQAEIDYTEEHHNAIVQQTDCVAVVYDTIRETVTVRDSTYEKSVYKEVTERKTPWYFKVKVLFLLLGIAFALGGYTAWKIK